MLTQLTIEAYLENDPELAKMVQKERETGFSDVPKPLAKEVEMEAYKKANMLNGFDDIDYLLNIKEQIREFAEDRPL